MWVSLGGQAEEGETIVPLRTRAVLHNVCLWQTAADKKVMSADDQISFTVTVKNTGDREGQEVVQFVYQ